MNQNDALFSINLFKQLSSTCFEQACCSSAGVSTLYKLLPAGSQHNAWLYQLLFIQSWSSW